MITVEGKRICDHEFRNRQGMWCGCRRPAAVKVASKAVPHMELDYCARHAPRTEEVLSFSNGAVLNESGRLVFRRSDQKPTCPYCGATEGLRVKCDGGGYIAPEYTCEDCFTATDTGPCFDDLPEFALVRGAVL